MERPEVIINVACSLDGVIASSEGALILSTTEDFVRVHELRNSVDAILVGVNTIIKDDPLLSVRYVQPKQPAPFRVILDTNCRIPLTSKVLQNQNKSPSIVIVSAEASKQNLDEIQSLGIKVIKAKMDEDERFLDLENVLEELKEQFNIDKILVEGGSTIITQFLNNRLVDVMYIFS